MPSQRKKLQIENASKKTISAARVKLADKYDNCLDLAKNPPKGWDLNRIQGYFLWSNCVVKSLNSNEPIKQDPICMHLTQSLNAIFCSTFNFQESKVNCIDKGTSLVQYYESLDKKESVKETSTLPLLV